MSSVGSVAAASDNQHIKRLILACSAGKEDEVRQLLSEGDWTSPLDRDALRHGLQRVAARGNVNLSQFMLEHGAEIDARRETEVAAIFRAAENGHVKITRMLVERRANLEAKDRYGRTAIFPAALKGYIEVLKLLLGAGANINARDKDGKTVLIHLASEKLFRWNETICQYLLDMDADIEAMDITKRTALTWAADYGKYEMVKLLLEGKKKANVEANNNRGRNALHFAAEKNHESIVSLLLKHDANPRTSSDGGWTALHNAAEKGHLKVVELLLAADASVNAELSNGMTALHWAAQNGHEEVVEAILTRPDTKLSIKDSFDRTPMLCAAEQGHRDIVYLLSPGRNGNRLSQAALGACESFEATVVDFGIDAVPRERKQRVLKNTVYDLIYGWDSTNNKPKVPTQVKNIKVNPSFRWIHIPANNLAWVEAMLTKAFVESGHQEIDDFKALEKCFSQEHRGAQVHASFMRPYCHRIPPMSVAKAYNATPPSPMPPIILQEEGGSGGGSSKTPLIYVEPATPGSTPLKGSLATLPEKSSDKSDKSDRENMPKTEKKKTKSEKLAERQGKKGLKTDSPKGTPTKVKGGIRHPHPKPKPVAIPALPSGKLVLFMPFLHYESDASREKMSQAIKRTYIHNDPLLKPPERPTADDLLIEAYLSSTPALHARRTLDQFFYHGIDTSDRDQDQVVYRYCKRRKLERKVFMVDQLWMWILGKDLIITSFPQRWQQPKNDPLNVLDGIIEDMNAKTRPPVKSVYDLAMLITSRCSGMFDRHRYVDENYQFIDMFESSIGHVTNKETKLFARFNRASAAAGKWLKSNRRGRGVRRILMGKGDMKDEDETSGDNDPKFVDTLLDIGTETMLLAEIKDIRDELNIIRMVLTSQLNILPDLADHICDELGGGKRTTEAGEFVKRSKDQMKIIEVHIKDLDRMDKQADLIYNSLTHLLDLKQKHANAFEARFAREQAKLTARQGQTIMVFTIVTIVFLPMGFIASFFNINIAEFQRIGTDAQIPLNYVAKYMFGIGLGISIPLIFLAFAVDDVASLARKIAYGFVRLIPGLRQKQEESGNGPEETLWRRRYSESRYSETTEKHRVQTELWEAPPRSSMQRDLSPMSHRSGRSTLQGNHVSWNRSSNSRGRISEDL